MTGVAARFGGNLARCRRMAGVTQEELSSLASLHRTEVGLLERGLRIPRIDTLVKVRDALKVSADDLLDGIAWSPGDYRPGGFVEGDEER